MSSYYDLKYPSQPELNRRIVDRLGPQLRLNKRYGSEAAAILNSTRSNKEKKNALINITARRQKDPSGFSGGSTRNRRRHRTHRRRTHTRRTSRS